MKLVHRLWCLQDLCIMFSGFVTRLWLENSSQVGATCSTCSEQFSSDSEFMDQDTLYSTSRTMIPSCSEIHELAQSLCCSFRWQFFRVRSCCMLDEFVDKASIHLVRFDAVINSSVGYLDLAFKAGSWFIHVQIMICKELLPARMQNCSCNSWMCCCNFSLFGGPIAEACRILDTFKNGSRNWKQHTTKKQTATR